MVGSRRWAAALVALAGAFVLPMCSSPERDAVPRDEAAATPAARRPCDDLRVALRSARTAGRTGTARRLRGELRRCRRAVTLAKTEIVFNWVAARNGESDDLFVVSSDGIQVLKLHQTFEFNEANAAWSPDGKRLAFEGRDYRDERAGLYVMAADGTRRRLLVAGDVHDPAWSPDGTRVAFSMRAKGRTAAIYVVNGAGVRRLTDEIDARRPSWSPDGSRIAYQVGEFFTAPDAVGRPSLYVMNADGTASRRLRFGGAPDWSPSGDELLFSDCRSCPTDQKSASLETFVMTSDGRQVRNLTQRGGPGDRDWLASWGPDGRRIVFVSNRDGSGDEIWVMEADGTGAAAVTGRADWMVSQDSEPDWRPR